MEILEKLLESGATVDFQDRVSKGAGIGWEVGGCGLEVGGCGLVVRRLWVGG